MKGSAVDPFPLSSFFLFFFFSFWDPGSVALSGDMIDVVSKKCAHEDCATRPTVAFREKGSTPCLFNS